MVMTNYMDLLAANQPWNLILFMVIPVVLAESLVATEFYTTYYNGKAAGWKTWNHWLGIAAGVYFALVVLYLLVNVVARKAREIADDAENLGEHLSEKPVTLAINGVAAGEVAVDREDLYNALNADERIATSSAPTMADVSEEETEE